MNDSEVVKRTECGVSEIPKWAIAYGKGIINIVVGEDLFIATQHITVRVEWHEGDVNVMCSEVLAAKGWAVNALPAATVGRAYGLKGERGFKRGFVVCDIGAVRVNLRYVLLVERLFPGCTWAAPTSARIAPVQAIVGGVIVALIAGQEPDARPGERVGEESAS